MEEVKKKPNWKKIAIISVVVVLLLTIGAIIWTETLWHSVIRDVFGKETTQVTDRVRVYLKWNDREDFYFQKYTKKDFKWGNVKDIEYKEVPYEGYPESDYVEAFIVVYLKNTGEEQCKRAILYFERLDFVYEAIFEDDIESRERLVW